MSRPVRAPSPGRLTACCRRGADGCVSAARPRPPPSRSESGTPRSLRILNGARPAQNRQDRYSAIQLPAPARDQEFLRQCGSSRRTRGSRPPWLGAAIDPGAGASRHASLSPREVHAAAPRACREARTSDRAWRLTCPLELSAPVAPRLLLLQPGFRPETCPQLGGSRQDPAEPTGRRLSAKVFLVQGPAGRPGRSLFPRA